MNHQNPHSIIDSFIFLRISKTCVERSSGVYGLTHGKLILVDRAGKDLLLLRKKLFLDVFSVFILKVYL